MEQIIKYSRFKFTYLLFSFAFAILFTSCNKDDENSLSDVSVSMKTLPQVKYVLGNALDLSDMVITINKEGDAVDVPFSDFASENITTEPENGKILELSDDTVIVKVGDSGSGLIQVIDVTNNVVATAIKTEPVKDYVAGQRLDLTNLVVTLTRENGEAEDVSYSEFGEDIITAPEHGIVLSTDNTEVLITHVTSDLSVVQAINVSAFLPSSGTLVNAPLKTEYAVGDLLDLTGTLITYTMFDGTEVDVAAEDFALFGLTASPAHGTVLEATDTEVRVSHLFGARATIPLVINE